jgi:hypothetical protein
MLKRRLKEPFGKAGLTVAILALVLAMVGGAYAAGALSGKQKKEVEKIAKKYAGKPGAAGANGTNGTNGSPGTAGGAGAPGANGKSVVIGTATTCGAAGGKTVEVEGSGVKNPICNGKQGEAGEPWTPNNTLPSGATETGTWSYSSLENGGNLLVPISFPIKLPATQCEIEPGPPPVFAEQGLCKDHVHFVEASGSPPAQCPGTTAEPAAEPGNLCIYYKFTLGIETSSGEPVQFIVDPGTFNPFSPATSLGAGTTGALLHFHNEANATEPTAPGFGEGTWALTG